MYFSTSSGFYTMERKGSDNFVFSTTPLVFPMPPSTFMNDRRLYLKPSSTSGEITITVVAPEGEELDKSMAPLFYDSDKGHRITLKYVADNRDAFYYLIITDYIAPTVAGGYASVKCKVDKYLSGTETLPSSDPYSKWQISVFSSKRGYPKAMTLFEGRLILANTDSYPTGIWGSSLVYGDLFNFMEGGYPGDALSHNLSANSDGILWLTSQSKIFAGTSEAIHVIGSALYNDEALSSSNFKGRVFTSIGASPLQPISILDSIFFVDSSGKNLHEIVLSAGTPLTGGDSYDKMIFVIGGEFFSKEYFICFPNGLCEIQELF
jgi:hypothetical protein